MYWTLDVIIIHLLTHEHLNKLNILNAPFMLVSLSRQMRLSPSQLPDIMRGAEYVPEALAMLYLPIQTAHAHVTIFCAK